MRRILITLLLGLGTRSTAGLTEAVGPIRSSSALFVAARDRTHPLALSPGENVKPFATNKIARGVGHAQTGDPLEPEAAEPAEGWYPREDEEPVVVMGGLPEAGELDTLARGDLDVLGSEAWLTRGIGPRVREETGPRERAASGSQWAGASRRMHMVESLDGAAPASSGLWFEAILASFLLTLCSLVGIVTFISEDVAKKITVPLAFMLASGALLTTTLVNIIPTAFRVLKGYSDFDLMTTRAGAVLFAGVFAGLALHALLGGGHHHHAHGLSNGDASIVDADGFGEQAGALELEAMRVSKTHVGAVVTMVSGEGTYGVSSGGGASSTAPSSTASFRSPAQGRDASAAPDGEPHRATTLHDVRMNTNRRSLCDVKGLGPMSWNAILGDLTHNFADGVSVGAAFLVCGSTGGWSVTAASMLHEVPHELANFMVLVNGGMSPYQALVFNSVSGVFSVLGTLLVLSLRDTITLSDISFLLLFGAGVLTFVALAELTPEALADKGAAGGLESSGRGTMYKLAAFVVGAAILAIPLLAEDSCA